MTPADCQAAANMFDAAYRAIQAQRRGLLAMPDGTDRMIPVNESISPMPAQASQVTIMSATVRQAAEVSGAVQGLARSVAFFNAKAGLTQMFTLPLDGPVSAVSASGMLPCRARLIGTGRDTMLIEIAVRA
jgi:hypothetical protein